MTKVPVAGVSESVKNGAPLLTPSQSMGPYATKRIASVDIMRGLAMVLVIVAHAYALRRPGSLPEALETALIRCFNMATVSFVFVSGIMLAYFLESRTDPAAVQRRFGRRALLLLGPVHVLLVCVLIPWNGLSLREAGWRWYVTDTIALCLLVGPLVIRRSTNGSRMAIISLLLIGSATLRGLWAPDDVLSAAVKEALVDQPAGSPHLLHGTFPILPWLAVFLAGSLLGGELAAVGSGALPASGLVRRMRTGGLYLLALGIVLTGAYKVARLLAAPGPPHPVLDALYPDRLTTLFPAYIGALLAGFSLVVRRADQLCERSAVGWSASVLGRTSLFAFVMQFGLVWSVPALLGWRGAVPTGALLPLACIAVGVVWSCCYGYGVVRGRVDRTPSAYRRLARTWGVSGGACREA